MSVRKLVSMTIHVTGVRIPVFVLITTLICLGRFMNRPGINRAKSKGAVNGGDNCKEGILDFNFLKSTKSFRKIGNENTKKIISFQEYWDFLFFFIRFCYLKKKNVDNILSKSLKVHKQKSIILSWKKYIKLNFFFTFHSYLFFIF